MNRLQISKRKWHDSSYFVWTAACTGCTFVFVILCLALMLYYGGMLEGFLLYLLFFGLTVGLIPGVILLILHIKDVRAFNRAVSTGKFVSGTITDVWFYPYNMLRAITVKYSYNGITYHNIIHPWNFIDNHEFMLYVREDPSIGILIDFVSGKHFILESDYIDRRRKDTDLVCYKKRKDGSYVMKNYPDYRSIIHNPIEVEGYYRRTLSNLKRHPGISNYFVRDYSLYTYIEAVVTYFDPKTGDQIDFMGGAWISPLMDAHYRQSSYDFPVKVIVNEEDLSEYRICLDETFERILEY